MRCFLLVAALFIQFLRQPAETLTDALPLRGLPPAECRARILQPLRQHISAPPAAIACITPAWRLVGALMGLECVDVQLESRKLLSSLARG